MDEPVMPSLPQKIANLTKTLVEEGKAIVRGDEPCSADEHARRLNICLACPWITEESTCRWCGCNMTIKSGLRSVTCADKNNPRW